MAVGPVVIGVGHVVTVQLLPAFATEATQATTGTLAVLFGAQLDDVQLFPAAAAAVTQFWTPIGPVVTDAGQVVAVQLLPAAAAEPAQLRTGTFVVLLVPQIVAVQLLPAAAAMAAQVCTPNGPVVAGAGHVVVVQLLPEVAAEAVQVCTPTLLVLLVVQVVAV